MGNSVNFKQGAKKTRSELNLPQLHFVAADQWIDTLGNHAFVAWLKFYSWADRRDKDRENDFVPNSMESLKKKLGVSKETLYNKIIRPLWNYGLIDLTEVEHTGYFDVNVTVYEYPQNDFSQSTKDLVKIRDYDTEYKSAARSRAIKITEMREAKRKVSKEIEQGGRSEIEQEAVRKSNRGPFGNRTGGRSEIELYNYKEESFNDPELNDLEQQQHGEHENVVVESQTISNLLLDIKESLGVKPGKSKIENLVIQYGESHVRTMLDKVAKEHYISPYRSPVGVLVSQCEEEWEVAYHEPIQKRTSIFDDWE